MTTLSYVHQYVIPAALALLPPGMDTPEARAMLLAIGLQESGFRARVQLPQGPAHGFWQFERMTGVLGVLTGTATAAHLRPALKMLQYDEPTAAECYAAIAHSDVLACVFARLLLWSLPAGLPAVNQPQLGWTQYLAAWRPGKPRPETWLANFEEAWKQVRS